MVAPVGSAPRKYKKKNHFDTATETPTGTWVQIGIDCYNFTRSKSP